MTEHCFYNGIRKAMGVLTMRIFAKIMAAIGIVPLKTIGIIIEILAKISCVLAGPFLVFLIGCGIYCVMKTNWQSLIVLALAAGGVILFYVLTGLILGAIDIAGNRMKTFLRS